jgi:predicted DNA-binding transcriptional regulator AlpA
MLRYRDIFNEASMNTEIGDRLLSPAVVFEKVSLSRTTIWRLVKSHAFPQPIRLTPGRHAWSAHDVDRWIEAKKSEAA